MSTARLMSLVEFRSQILSQWMQPTPSVRTLRAWFRRAKVPMTKANPRAVNGGGLLYVNVAAAEAYLRRRTGIST